MDDSEAITVASAVVVPCNITEQLKRSQLSSTLHASKRPRLDDRGVCTSIDTPPMTPISNDAGVMMAAITGKSKEVPTSPQIDRRRSGLEEEKRRGKRLFGALLGTIGKFQQDSTSQRARSNAVKRKEVEAKLQEKLKAQTEELDERQKKEDNDFNLRRREETREFEERAMQIRHCSLSARANMLATSTAPKLFYLPWKLLPIEEDTIRGQIVTAEETVCSAEAAFRNLARRNDKLVSPSGGDERDDGNGTTGDYTNLGHEEDTMVDCPQHDGISESIDNSNDAEQKSHQLSTPTDCNHQRHSSITDGNCRTVPDIVDVDVVEEGGEDTVMY